MTANARSRRDSTVAGRLYGEEIRRAVQLLLPEIAARADETSSLRRLPADLAARLGCAGAFSLSMPCAWGGPEMDPVEQLELIESVARVDPSVGWCIWSGSEGGFLSAFLRQDAARELYADLDTATAGQWHPGGRARRVAGGYLVDGRWALASGCTHAGIMFAHCLLFDGDRPAIKDGVQDTRVLMAPARSWQILDTWYTTGMAGAGSHDFSAHGLFIPERHGFSILDAPHRTGPLYALPEMFLAGASGVALGLARGALDAVRALEGRKPGWAGAAQSGQAPAAHVCTALEHAQMLSGAARAYVYASVEAAWRQLQLTGAVTPESRTALELSRANAFRVAREVAQLMFDAAGTAAMYATSPLDRLLRDAMTMNQHCAPWRSGEQVQAIRHA